MTIEIYTHDQGTTEDFIRITEVSHIPAIQTIEYDSCEQRQEIMSKFCAKFYGFPRKDQHSGKLFQVTLTKENEATEYFSVLRGSIKVKDKGNIIFEVSNF